MKVKVIQQTQNPLEVMYTACKTCYSKLDSSELWDNILNNEPEKMKKLVLQVLNSGHRSVAEHVYLSFTIDGISRKTSHQLVRHRIAVYSQKSQRYVTYHQPFKYYVADSIKDKPEILEKYNKYMSDCQDFYNEMITEGIPAEDARDIFPNACHTSVVMSCNLREFIHICNLRLCKRAQSEIREMMKIMVKEVLKNNEYEFLKPFFVSNCANCIEHEGCKKVGEK